MLSMRNSLRITAFMVACAVLALALMLRPGHRVDTRDWRQRILNENGVRAYTEFKDELARQQSSQSERHARMHEFGAALYDSKGIDGIGVCDAMYDFGCYHGFFSRAVSDVGDSVIPKLAEACRTKFGKNSTGCEHGIGHGIMEYVGAAGLLRGLSLCEGTHQANPLYGCTSGLFMEYNTPMTYIDGTVRMAIRPFTPLHPRAPCDSVVPARFRSSCYFEISAWWGHVFADDEKAGNLCTQNSTETEKRSCWLGWGTVVAEQARYDADRAKPVCALIRDAQGRQDCMLGVAMRLFALKGYEKEAENICSGLSGDDVAVCAKLMH